MNKNTSNKKILIAAAWPYANGSLHLGHVASLIGADILARYFRLAGRDVLFVSGTDCHGTPITLEAGKRGVDPSIVSEEYHQEFVETLIDGLDFSYDLYTKTTTENHKEVVQGIFLELHKKGYVYPKEQKLPYCETCERILPDRFVIGTCPECNFDAARGDQCDNCGALLEPANLIDAKCVTCGNPPEWRETEHFLIKLSAFQDEIAKWVKQSKNWRPNATKFTLNLLEQGIHDRGITRDLDWGIKIPVDGYDDKRIYVWFEAVCGYLSASKEWAKNSGDEKKWESFWDEDALHYYVHGKDNIPFHTIIWPTILLGVGGLHLPDRIISSEYLTLEGKQFSKSRNWAVLLKDFLKDFDAETLRYYLVSNGPETSDADFSWEQYQTKTNTELIANLGNLVNRTASLIHKNFPEGVEFPEELDDKASAFLKQAEKTFDSVGQDIEQSNFRKALKSVFELAEEGNRFIHEAEPWATVKTNPERAAKDLAVTAHVLKCLAILVSPFLPRSGEEINRQLGITKTPAWAYPAPGTTKVVKVEPLYQRVEQEVVDRQKGQLG